jgi:mannose-6-phosphate isomerase-like protein (cupin superfamily)
MSSHPTIQSPHRAINFAEKLQLIDDQWQPRVVAEMNDYQFKLVRIEGDFIWHEHADTDETFIVVDGQLRIDMRDGSVLLSAGEMFVVPKGTNRTPSARSSCC